MSNCKYEQKLLTQYWDTIKNDNFSLINCNCRAKIYSDLEYIETTTTNKIHWRIEAKSHMSKDAYNAVHKIFGELLKETGRTPISDEVLVKYGILLDGRHSFITKMRGKEFFKKYFQCIEFEKYKKFGLLIPVEKIIIYTQGSPIITYGWNEFMEETED